jgi:hypothetical protein
MVTVPPGHWITLPAASQEKPGVEIRFVNGPTVSETTGPLPLVTFCDSRLPNPSYVQPSPHCGPLPGASRERLERKASPNSPCGRQPSAIEA